MRKLVLFILILSKLTMVYGGKAPTTCTLISGIIIKKPGKPVFKFNSAHNYSKNGYPMTHTQFFIKTHDAQVYKIIVDNLFYKDISLAQVSSFRDAGITTEFSRNYPVGSNVEACGKIINTNDKLAVHFVHPSGCRSNSFNGFLRINGVPVTDNEYYCGNCACKLN